MQSMPAPDLFVRLIGKPRIDGVSGLSTLVMLGGRVSRHSRGRGADR